MGASMSQGSIKVAICVCTYRRPEGLRNLLFHLLQLRFESMSEPEIEVVVVENEESGSARSICDEFEARLRWPLRYEIESDPGISNARNRCLEMAKGTDFIAFLDDDEMPAPLWLEALLLAQRKYCAEVVAGPVIGVYEQPPPPYLRKYPFHSSINEKSGTYVAECGAGNVLFSTGLIRQGNLRFEESMGLSGGEDKLFFISARRKGAKIVWCSEAVVEENIPPERTTIFWLLRREFRIGVAGHKCARYLAGSYSASFRSLWVGCTRIGAGLVSLPVTIAFGRHRSVRTLCRIAFGAGCILGASGYEFNAYRPKS
jgi:succinoglycan biosynthesis protein ExoM